MLAAAARLRRAIGGLAAVMSAVAGWTYVAAALFVTADVLGRNFLRVSTASTVELTGYMLAGGIAWGLAGALLERAHIRVDVLANRLPLRLRQWLHLLALLLLGAFSGFVAWAAWELVDESLLFEAHDNSALRIPMAVPQAFWAFGISVFCVAIAVLLAEALLLIAAGRAEAVDRLLAARGFQEETEEALAAVGQARAPAKP